MHPSHSFVVASLFAAVVLAPAAAQGARQTVIPGRDFVAHKLLTPGLTDVWDLEVDIDEMLLCVVESSSFDPVLELVDEQGQVVGSNDGAGTRSELWLRAASKGAYKFRVSPFQGSGGGNYSYHLHRFRTEPLGTATEALHTFGKEQWWHYRIALREGDVLVPTVLGEGRLRVVMDAGRNAVGEQHGGYRAPRDGDYFVGVEGAQDKRCQTLTQLARLGDRCREELHQEQIAPYGQDRWRLPIAAGQCLVLDLRMPQAQIAFDVREVNPTDQGPAFVATGHFDKGGARRQLWYARRDATVELLLRHAGSTAAPYEFALREYGSTARFGETYEARLPLGDGALFHLQLAAGELLDLRARSDAFNANLDLWDPDGNVIARVDDAGPLDRNPAHRFLVMRPGIYHVLVHSRGAGSGPFSFCTESRPLVQLQKDEVQPVQRGSHLHLQLEAGEVVWLSLHSTTFDAALQVVDPVGDSGFVADGGGVGGDVLVAYRASHSGRHTLIVHARSGHGAGELKVVRP